MAWKSEAKIQELAGPLFIFSAQCRLCEQILSPAFSYYITLRTTIDRLRDVGIFMNVTRKYFPDSLHLCSVNNIVNKWGKNKHNKAVRLFWDDTYHNDNADGDNKVNKANQKSNPSFLFYSNRNIIKY